MRRMLTQLRPSCFEDLIAVLALYPPRAARQRHGRRELHQAQARQGADPLPAIPPLETILRETYGVIVYQEQVMQIAQALAGYSLGDADNLRRAMGKKKAEEMAKERERFLARRGGAGNGRPTSSRPTIFEQMETFAAYGFNKCHSRRLRADHRIQTAYLKAHYPTEFMAGLLSLEAGRHRQHLQEHRRMPVERHRASCRPTSTRAARTSRPPARRSASDSAR